MGQSLGNRVNRPSWFGDMEPEYEDMLEWIVATKVKKTFPDRNLPLQRYWIPTPTTPIQPGVACQ